MVDISTRRGSRGTSSSRHRLRRIFLVVITIIIAIYILSLRLLLLHTPSTMLPKTYSNNGPPPKTSSSSLSSPRQQNEGEEEPVPVVSLIHQMMDYIYHRPLRETVREKMSIPPSSSHARGENKEYMTEHDHGDNNSSKNGNNDDNDNDDNDDDLDNLNVKFFGTHTTEGNCTLSAKSITFLACGADGHVFAAVMSCYKNNNSPKVTTSLGHSSSGTTTTTIILKVRHDGKSKFISETSSVLSKQEEIYNALFTTNTASTTSITTTTTTTTQHERERFAISIGTVATVTPKSLINAVRRYNQTHSYTREICLRVIAPSSHTPSSNGNTTKTTTLDINRIDHIDEYDEYETTPVIGNIHAFAHGKQPIQPRKLTSRSERRHVAAELICIYRHMYRRNVLHDDISNTHLLYNPEEEGERSNGDATDTSDTSRKTVTLVDFSRVKLFATNNKTNKKKKQQQHRHYEKERSERQVQQLQLMTLIANVCTQSENKFYVPNRASNVERYLEPLMRRRYNLTVAMDRCSNLHTYQSSSSASSSSSLAEDLLENNYTVEETYDILYRWSGAVCE